MSLPYSMPKGWTFAPDSWGDPNLVKPLFGKYANSSMHADSALAKCLGFTLTGTQVQLLKTESILKQNGIRK